MLCTGLHFPVRPLFVLSSARIFYIATSMPMSWDMREQAVFIRHFSDPGERQSCGKAAPGVPLWQYVFVTMSGTEENTRRYAQYAKMAILGHFDILGILMQLCFPCLCAFIRVVVGLSYRKFILFTVDIRKCIPKKPVLISETNSVIFSRNASVTLVDIIDRSSG